MTRLTATITNEFRFEGAIGDGWSAVTGTGGAIDTGVFYRGAQSAYWDAAGASNFRQLTIATKIIVASIYVRLKTDASGTSPFLICNNGSISLQLQWRAGQKIRANCGATNSVDSAALTLGQWYLIDFSADTTTGTAAVAYSIDTVAQAGATVANASTNMVNFRLGVTGTNTYQAYYDELVISQTAADFPIGALSAKRSLAVAA